MKCGQISQSISVRKSIVNFKSYLNLKISPVYAFVDTFSVANMTLMSQSPEVREVKGHIHGSSLDLRVVSGVQGRLCKTPFLHLPGTPSLHLLTLRRSSRL